MLHGGRGYSVTFLAHGLAAQVVANILGAILSKSRIDYGRTRPIPDIMTTILE